jgi:hypothetical protein
VAFTVIFLSLAFVAAILATPSDEITRAVTTSGGASVQKATTHQFVNAFSAVLTRVKGKNAPGYVSSAVKLRPDLAPQITVAAINVVRPNEAGVDAKSPCEWAGSIFQAAVTAAPAAKEAIERAVIAADPDLRDCIVESPGEGPGSALNSANNTLGTINPSNTRGVVTSEEQPPRP